MFSRWLVLIVALIFCLPVLSNGAIIVTTADINLLDGPHSQVSSSPASIISSSANAGDAASMATADMAARLGTMARSKGNGLANIAGATSHYSSGFHLAGNSTGATLPLSFNFDMHGSLRATSAATNLLSLGSGTITYDLQTSRTRFNGSAQLRSQGGTPLTFTSGQFVGGASLSSIDITATVNGDLFILTDEELQYLGIHPTSFANVQFSDAGTMFSSHLANQVSNSILALGLPSHQLIPGVQASIGFDVDYSFDSHFSLGVDLLTSDALVMDLSSAASSTSDAEGTSAFGNTLKLSSITLPASFASPELSHLAVEFDSGLVMPVTFDQPASVPELPSLWLFVGIGISLGASRLAKYRLPSMHNRGIV